VEGYGEKVEGYGVKGGRIWGKGGRIWGSATLWKIRSLTKGGRIWEGENFLFAYLDYRQTLEQTGKGGRIWGGRTEVFKHTTQAALEESSGIS